MQLNLVRISKTISMVYLVKLADWRSLQVSQPNCVLPSLIIFYTNSGYVTAVIVQVDIAY